MAAVEADESSTVAAVGKPSGRGGGRGSGRGSARGRGGAQQDKQQGSRTAAKRKKSRTLGSAGAIFSMGCKLTQVSSLAPGWRKTSLPSAAERHRHRAAGPY